MSIRISLAVLFAAQAAWGGVSDMPSNDVPEDAVHDSVMATPAEVQAVADWIEAALTGTTRPAAIPIEVVRQDFNVLHFGESCMDTPITLADTVYEHGLGTHANSEIAVTLPPKARRFKAFVGVDNNFDTQRARGSVEFAVEADGRELFRTPVLRCGEPPCPVDVEIPAGTGKLTLKVDTTADGPGWDQSDWADARLVMDDGSEVYLDEGRRNEFLGRGGLPFSFLYGGVPSRELMRDWPTDVQREETATRRILRAEWTDPKTGLKVTAEATTFTRYPAVDWVVYLENTGDADTPVLENIQGCDVRLETGNAKRIATLQRINGDVCNASSFQPIESIIGANEKLAFAPTGGRSSNGAFPFFEVTYLQRGVIAAIGWSGQWAAALDRSAEGPTILRTGMERTRLVLHPGERIRTPRTLLMPYEGDPLIARNRFRRLMLFEYVPQQDGRPVRLPVASQCFDRYSWTRPEWATEAGQIAAAQFARDAGFSAHWFDAAWFPGGFPGGVGNWFCKPEAFPKGLKPVSDACHANDLDFVLWFEPERVGNESEIARDHPDYVYGGANGGLFKLDDPAARAWITELLVRRIGEYGLDVYRQDFNMDPLDAWRANDAPDRQGMTEIRYVEGLYELWDTIRARYPEILIDNCASGGRRIDLETCMRAIPFWRSDTNCTPGHADWNQAHTSGLSRYVPLHMACAWTPDRYTLRSAATAGLICQWDYMDPAFPLELAKGALAEAVRNTRYWYGDFYPVVAAGSVEDQWSVTQLHRPDLDEGLVLAFRRDRSPYVALTLVLRGVDGARTYTLEQTDDHGAATQLTVPGEQLLSGWELRMPDKATSLVIRYKATP